VKGTLVELIADEIEFEDSNGALSRVYSIMWQAADRGQYAQTL
jgi:hypothetical protein